ncbi:proteinase-activated receptor 4 isoform X2 [Gadus chalcogrammus]|uniref:proteinase-activated receptor 4 isoform X2 n=1 Tax=Gadus chalcogrammus TaxID=1042646 RepID=UPI0024C4A935|nr:proteinase-activated receptor 4 isoform X2 [Gadus chalcogrammus]
MRGWVLVNGAAESIWKEELCGVGPVVDPEKNRPLIALLSEVRSPSTFDGWEEEAGRRKRGVIQPLSLLLEQIPCSAGERRHGRLGSMRDAAVPMWRTLLVIGLLAAQVRLSYPNPMEECSGMGVRLRSFNLMTKCNSTTLREKSLQQIQAPTTNLFIPILYLFALCVGLPANLLALWVLVFRTKKLPSTTLLINLTAGDIMLLLVLPFRIVYHLKGNDWVFGEPFCRIVMAMFYGNMYGCNLCLALVALDRYVALVHPFGAKVLRSRRTSLYMSLVVWMVVIAAMVPLLVSQQSYVLDELQITTCHDALPVQEQETYFLPYFTTLFTLCFLLPFLVIVYCYSAVLRTLVAGGKRYSHAVRVTALVLVVFLVCMLPSNILLLLTYSDSILDGEDIYLPYMVSLAVSTLNSCIDPFIYYYVSDDFREKVRNLLPCCGDRNDNSSSSGNPVSNSSSSRIKSQLTLLSKSSRQATIDEDAA